MMVILAAAALAAAQPAPADDPVATLAAVQDMYNQSCQVKAYAAYDDLCDALRKQIRDAERASDKAVAEQRRTAKISAAKAADPPTTATPPANATAAK